MLRMIEDEIIIVGAFLSQCNNNVNVLRSLLKLDML